MKKSDLRNLVAYLRGDNTVDIASALQALEGELAKDTEHKDAKQAEYNQLWGIVCAHMSTIPMTVADLYKECESELPEGVTKSKLQYALNNYWSESGLVVKIQPGNRQPNTYRLP